MCNALNDLTDGEYVASDLSEAIERWNQRCDEYAAEQKARERQRLLDLARRDIDGRSA